MTTNNPLSQGAWDQMYLVFQKSSNLGIVMCVCVYYCYMYYISKYSEMESRSKHATLFGFTDSCIYAAWRQLHSVFNVPVLTPSNHTRSPVENLYHLAFRFEGNIKISVFGLGMLSLWYSIYCLVSMGSISVLGAVFLTCLIPLFCLLLCFTLPSSWKSPFPRCPGFCQPLFPQ